MASAVAEVEGCGEVSTDDGSSRRALLGTVAAVGAFASVPLIGRLFRLGDAVGAPSPAQDTKILQLVQLLEATQVAFYAQAPSRAGLKGKLRDFAQTALGHERGRVSHGCIRLRNADILRLAALMPVGTPVTIR